ncbi:MAG TPA: hypothetical protein VK019_03640, partial [Pseudomonas sp.]|nr:hypothetical protein [Pseudomonas sp.]
MSKPVPTAERNRNRGMLIAIVVLFLGSALVAGVLRFSGWMPEGTRSHGELLQPPVDLRETTLRLQDGGEYPWDPEARIWRIVVPAPANCGEPCVELSAGLDTVWRLFARRADRVHTLWVGDFPEEGVRNRSLRLVEPDPALQA